MRTIAEAPPAGTPRTPQRWGRGRKLLVTTATAVAVLIAASYVLLSSYARWGTREEERRTPLTGDQLVPHPRTGYTLAITIRAAPSEVWPWLVQVGQGRGGFYTHEWVENLLGADIHNADRIVPSLQTLAVGDTIRLTPDPYLGQPGQFMTVAQIRPQRALVFRQTLPNGSLTSWAFELRPEAGGTTRLLTRRRGTEPTRFDRLMLPGYLFMDHGMLRGIRRRAEAAVGQKEDRRP